MTVKEIAAELYAAWFTTTNDKHYAEYAAQYQDAHEAFRERFESAIARLMPQRRAVRDRDGDTWEQNGGGKWQIARHRGEWLGHEADWFEKTYGPLTDLDPPAEAKPTTPALQSFDPYAALQTFRKQLIDQLHDCTKEQQWCKVSKIAAAANVMTDLLNMPAVKAWELLF